MIGFLLAACIFISFYLGIGICVIAVLHVIVPDDDDVDDKELGRLMVFGILIWPMCLLGAIWYGIKGLYQSVCGIEHVSIFEWIGKLANSTARKKELPEIDDDEDTFDGV